MAVELQGIEGLRAHQFWRKMCDKSAYTLSIHRQKSDGRMGKTDKVPVLDFGSRNSSSSIEVPIVDHGVIYPGLHDLHRKATDKAKPNNNDTSLKLPPLAPLAESSSWFLQSTGKLPADVESAVTVSSSALPPSALAASSLALSFAATNSVAGSQLAPLLTSSGFGGRSGPREAGRKGPAAAAAASTTQSLGQSQSAPTLHRSGRGR